MNVDVACAILLMALGTWKLLELMSVFVRFILSLIDSISRNSAPYNPDDWCHYHYEKKPCKHCEEEEIY